MTENNIYIHIYKTMYFLLLRENNKHSSISVLIIKKNTLIEVYFYVEKIILYRHDQKAWSIQNVVPAFILQKEGQKEPTGFKILIVRVMHKKAVVKVKTILAVFCLCFNIPGAWPYYYLINNPYHGIIRERLQGQPADPGAHILQNIFIKHLFWNEIKVKCPTGKE